METILCPTDFSAWSENAVKYAHELAQLMRARLILFHSISVAAAPVAALSNGLDITDTLPYPEEYDIAGKLAQLKQKLEAGSQPNAVPIQTMVMNGAARDTIPALVGQEKIDLVVVGHEEPEEPLQVPSEIDIVNLLVKGTCPVLVIPLQIVFKPIWKIAYATDLKREPAADCAFLLRIAHLFNAEIMLLHVLLQDAVGARELATEELQKVYRRLPYRNVSYYIEANEVAETGINDFIKQNRADLLVVSSHPKKRWQQMLPDKHSLLASHKTPLPILIRQQTCKVPETQTV